MQHRVIDLGASARDVTKIIFLLAHRQVNERLTTVHLTENIDAVILRAAYTTDAVFCTCHELACSHLSFSRNTHLRPSAVALERSGRSPSIHCRAQMRPPLPKFLSQLDCTWIVIICRSEGHRAHMSTLNLPYMIACRSFKDICSRNYFRSWGVLYCSKYST